MSGNTATCVPVKELSESHGCYSRLQELRKFYVKEFDEEPRFYVRVPGRVNIIGEHVDYCGYPVLPMAIEQSILLAVGYTRANNFLYLRNIDVNFDNYKCDLKSFRIDIPEKGGPEWYKYFLCGVKGIFENINEQDQGCIAMTVALSGNIPHGSGLSSSSALVSSATLATSFAYKASLDRKTLASISASCERYIGTQGGGMDQAIAFLAEAGCAQFIEFYPELKTSSIQLPENACFVVANSLAEINKAASSDFNERVVECRLSCRIIAKRMDFKNWKNMLRFAELQSSLNCHLNELETMASKILTKDIYSREDVLNELEISEDEFENDCLTPNTRKMSLFKLRQRALHVIQESLRVQIFRSTCESTMTWGKIDTLSKLMQQSHGSLKNLYECSHPDLDRLIDISEEAGVGARLTGAGWGGCIVALCDSVQSSNKYIELLKLKYYSKLSKVQQSNLENVIFATFPQNGAEILMAGSNDIPSKI
ncbi:N-acetylgalactosamine kinase [Episyrphus balteatus]|uniref:N-acetylgalactosamine kinase n=1 Tax=Episyrphus balteatus TaxID=286459 RepID=UPI002485F2C8|nr:N-acetylgalactosamine kinase [Episyrphus balteatus]